MNDILLSIIVPVYNVAKYLQKCLDSLLNQNLDVDNYEIIVVNDGSTDNSGEIARNYANQYPNIILIDQDNQGLSGARNTGIKAARGKYIQFVDSDDYLEPNVEKTLLEKIEEDDLDIFRFNYQNVNEEYEVFHPNKDPKRYVDYSCDVCDGLVFLNERLGPACYVVQFILRAELVKSVPLFKEGIYFEDVEWTPRVLTAAKRVASDSRIVYNYLVRQGSITKAQSVEKKRKVVDDKVFLIKLIKDQMADKSDQRWYEGMIAETVISLLGAIVTDFYDERKMYIQKLKGLHVFPLSDYHLNKGGLRKRKLINLSPELYCRLIRLKK